MTRSLFPRFTALVALVGSLALASCNDAGKKPAGPPPAAPVTVAKPVVRTVVEQDDYTGRFEAVGSVEVRSRVGGVLESVKFTDGGLVKKGDLLFVIDQRTYQAAVDQAAAAVKSAKARVEFTSGDLDRAQNLQKTGNISEQLLETRRQSALVALADVAGAEANLEAARLNLSFTEIYAPISGRIGRKELTEGNLVSANTTLLTSIVSVDPIYFYFDIDERSFIAYQRLADHQGAKKGVDVLIALSDEDKPTIPGKLDFFSNRLDQSTGTMRARAVVPNPKMFLVPGMFGVIRIPGSAPTRGVLVPDSAIQADQSRRFVWVINDEGVASARIVRPGPRIDGYRLIRSGLSGDETIVVNGLQRVRPGAKVTPTMTTLPPMGAGGDAPAPAMANGAQGQKPGGAGSTGDKPAAGGAAPARQ